MRQHDHIDGDTDTPILHGWRANGRLRAVCDLPKSAPGGKLIATQRQTQCMSLVPAHTSQQAFRETPT